MKIAIHQPHYFPWIGYFNKMAKVDKFIILDEVQFVKGSQMIRNRVIDQNGNIKYITIMGNTKDCFERPYSDLEVKNTEVWINRQKNALRNYYRRCEGFDEMNELLGNFFDNSFSTICEWTCESVKFIHDLLNIKTPLILQSELEYDIEAKKSDLVLDICKVMQADTYFSGKGASANYLDIEKFNNQGIKVEFQEFSHPQYPQMNSQEFIPGISILDLLFNCGVKQANAIFWNNVNE